MAVPVGLSTGSVYPEPTSAGFFRAAELGYDGVEVMVQTELASQNPDAIKAFSDRYGMPVLAVHSPCLLVTSTVWSTDPLVKLARSIDMAEKVGAATVVLHPPFVWQRAAAATFTQSVAELQERTDVVIAVENMFPVRAAGAEMNGYRPHWDPVSAGHAHFTLDLSHTATSGSDAWDMLARMGSRMSHLHLTDGSGSTKDEHLVPGRGSQPCARILRALGAGGAGSAGAAGGTGAAGGADSADGRSDSAEIFGQGGFSGSVVVEISTRGVTAAQRVTDLTESLAFAREHLG